MVLLFQLKEKSLSCVTSLPTSLHKVKIHINTSKPITVNMCVNINYIYANIYACMPAWTCVCFVHFGCRDILAMGVRTCIYARFSLTTFFSYSLATGQCKGQCCCLQSVQNNVRASQRKNGGAMRTWGCHYWASHICPRSVSGSNGAYTYILI